MVGADDVNALDGTRDEAVLAILLKEPRVVDRPLDLLRPTTGLRSCERLERAPLVEATPIEAVARHAVARVPFVVEDFPGKQPFGVNALALHEDGEVSAPEDERVTHDHGRVLLVHALTVELALEKLAHLASALLVLPVAGRRVSHRKRPTLGYLGLQGVDAAAADVVRERRLLVLAPAQASAAHDVLLRLLVEPEVQLVGVDAPSALLGDRREHGGQSPVDDVLGLRRPVCVR